MSAHKKILRCLVLSLFLAATSLSYVRIVKADPPPWAPAHGYRHHHHDDDEDEDDQGHHHHHAIYKYYYYPAQQVYYSPVNRNYYYLDNGAWVSGVILPPRIQLGRYVNIDLGTPVPYTQHTTVIQTYPVIVR